MRRIKVIYLALLFLCGTVSAQDTTIMDLPFIQSEEPVTYDSSEVTVREISREKADDIRGESRYHYLRGDKSLNLWEEMMKRLQNLIRYILERFNLPEPDPSSVMNAAEVIMYLLIFAGIALLIFLIYRARFRGLLSRRRLRSSAEETYELFEEDIYEISYESEIEKAVREGNYRRAVRLRFLQTLKLLSDAELIEWKTNRTNREYLHHLADPSISQSFRKLVLWYEYAWYGEFAVTLYQYEKFAELEKEFDTLVRSRYTITAESGKE